MFSERSKPSVERIFEVEMMKLEEGGEVGQLHGDFVWTILMCFFYFQHFENKHPKNPLPAELQAI